MHSTLLRTNSQKKLLNQAYLPKLIGHIEQYNEYDDDDDDFLRI
jgi:hypothetical protein